MGGRVGEDFHAPDYLTSLCQSGPTLKRMEVASRPAAPEPSKIWALTQCLLCHNNSRDQHGMEASCLKELRNKACDVLAIIKSQAPATLVLAEDGTTVDDDNYFLCLPVNTKFVALAGNEKWTHNSEGGTAWITQESFDRDETDSRAALKWKNVARQLKEDLSSITLMSKEKLQMLTDVLCSEQAKIMWQSRGSGTPSSRCLTRERKPVSPDSWWSFTSRLWRRKAASCRSSKSPELTLGMKGTLLTRALERAPLTLCLQARSS